MSAPSKAKSPASGVLQEVRKCLTRLGELPTAASGAEDILPLIDDLELVLGSVSTENADLAEELLCSYEQLGIVFEVTRQLASVQTEPEIIELFADCLARSFYNHRVLVFRPVEGGAWSQQNDASPVDATLAAAIRCASDTGTVVVESYPAESESGIAEVLVACVSAGQEQVCAIVLTCAGGRVRFRSADMLIMESLSTFCGDLIKGRRLLVELRQSSTAMVCALVNAVDQKDTYTSGHSSRVAFYATLLGKRVGLDPKDMQMLQWSALLHDVGKIGIRDDVLKKEGKLTAAEFDHMKEHPVRSFEVVREVPQLQGALAGVLHHHERYDGSGYPSGLHGEKIPLQARVLQIADIFDALTSDRAYRNAYDWERALAILQEESGQTVDPRLIVLFDELIRGRLCDDPQAWQRMFQEGNEFRQLQDALIAIEEVV